MAGTHSPFSPPPSGLREGFSPFCPKVFFFALRFSHFFFSAVFFSFFQGVGRLFFKASPSCLTFFPFVFFLRAPFSFFLQPSSPLTIHSLPPTCPTATLGFFFSPFSFFLCLPYIASSPPMISSLPTPAYDRPPLTFLFFFFFLGFFAVSFPLPLIFDGGGSFFFPGFLQGCLSCPPSFKGLIFFHFPRYFSPVLGCPSFFIRRVFPFYLRICTRRAFPVPPTLSVIPPLFSGSHPTNSCEYLFAPHPRWHALPNLRFSFLGLLMADSFCIRPPSEPFPPLQSPDYFFPSPALPARDLCSTFP